jgi:hypothetical protein
VSAAESISIRTMTSSRQASSSCETTNSEEILLEKEFDVFRLTRALLPTFVVHLLLNEVTPTTSLLLAANAGTSMMSIDDDKRISAEIISSIMIDVVDSTTARLFNL